MGDEGERRRSLGVLTFTVGGIFTEGLRLGVLKSTCWAWPSPVTLPTPESPKGLIKREEVFVYENRNLNFENRNM